MRKLYIVVAVVGAGAVGAVLLSHDTTAEQVRFVTATRGQLERQIVLQGPVLPARYATIAPKLPSRVARLYVHEGQAVRKGERVILLDASDLAIDVERKRLALERARLRREERVAGRLAGSDVGLGAALDDVEVRAAELELERSESMLSDSILTSPIDGTVVQLGARQGEMMSSLRANSGEGVIIAEADNYVIKGELDEYQAGEVKTGAAVSIEFEAIAGASARGTVVADPSLRRFRPDARQAAVFEVNVALEGTLPHGVTAGHTGTARIRSADTRQHLLVPVSSIVHLNGVDYVVERLPRGKFAHRPVVLGPDDNTRVAILEGLDENAAVAVGDLAALRRRFWPVH